MQEKSTLHQAALAYARSGVPVFPCVPGGKEPACPNGFYDATTDEKIIDAWWTASPDCNIALCPNDAGWLVVDVEPDGLDDWALAEGDKPDTYTVQSPRGGLHLYYAGSARSTVKGKNSGIVPGAAIDTRGIGGYVLVPPSIVAGKPYKVLHDHDIAPLPEWIARASVRGSAKNPGAVGELDLPGNIARARHRLSALVDRGDIAVEGRGGNNRTYQLACELLDLGLSPETSITLLEELWNPACQPPWSTEELETIFVNAASYHQNDAGAYGVAPAVEVFAGASLDKIAAASQQGQRSKFHMEDEAEQDEAKEPTWLIQDLIPERSTVLLYGPTQSYKSFLALDIALSLSTGTETFGTAPAIGPCFYAALEGRTNIKLKRRRAWKLAKQIDTRIENFFVGPAPMIAVEGEMQEFGDEIVRRCAGRRPKLIVLDTISKSMAGLNENDAGEASRFIRFCDSLVESMGCSVIAIGHTGKDGERGHRGSSAFQAGFDTVLEVKAHRATKAVSVHVRKHKDAEEPELPWHFEGRLVGPSLVFFPIDAGAFQTLTKGEDLYSPKKIGAALKTLGANGSDHGVTTAILAAELHPREQNQSDEAHASIVAKATRALGALAKSRLEPYCERSGSGLLWFLPAA